MPFSLAHRFRRSQFECAEVARCLSHPARIYILNYLILHGESHVDAIRSGSGMTRSGFSKHLEKLRLAGLIAYAESNPFIYYSLDEDRIKYFRERILELAAMFNA